MAKSREIVCKYYEAEGQCGKGHDGTFYHSCQHCSHYEPVRGSRPARINTKREKLTKARMRDI